MNNFQFLYNGYLKLFNCYRQKCGVLGIVPLVVVDVVVFVVVGFVVDVVVVIVVVVVCVVVVTGSSL